jgi:hypothetical protein
LVGGEFRSAWDTQETEVLSVLATLGQVRYALSDAVEGAMDWRKKFESLPRAND